MVVGVASVPTDDENVNHNQIKYANCSSFFLFSFHSKITLQIILECRQKSMGYGTCQNSVGTHTNNDYCIDFCRASMMHNEWLIYRYVEQLSDNKR